MALRIGTPQPAGLPLLNPQDLAAAQGPVPEDAPPVTDAPEGEPDEDDLEDRAGAKVSPEVARYFGPEGRCKNCTHYLEGQTGGECDIVAGPIDPEGSCSLFTPDADQLGAEGEEEGAGPDVAGAPAPPSTQGPPQGPGTEVK